MKMQHAGEDLLEEGGRWRWLFHRLEIQQTVLSCPHEEWQQSPRNLKIACCENQFNQRRLAAMTKQCEYCTTAAARIQHYLYSSTAV